MSQLEPIPSYALPFIGNEQELRKLGLKFNPLWQKWFLDVLQGIQTGGAVDHNSLGGLQGGTTGELYHLTAAEHSAVGGNVAATTVTDETTFGIAKVVGVATTYAREDHTHGSPTNPITAHEAAGDPHPQYLTAAEGNAAYQPLDSDLSAIAALSTTAFGRALLALADAAALRTAAALGTAAVAATGDFDAAGVAAAAIVTHVALADPHTQYALDTDLAGYQLLDADLTAIAALSTTAFGRALLALADASALRTAAALGTLATQNGTFSGTSSGTNTGDQTTVSGNAGTATALATARNINDVAFDGTANITVQPPLARIFLMMGA